MTARPSTAETPAALLAASSSTADDGTRRAMIWMVLGAFAFAGMGACTFALGNRCDWLVVATVRVVFMFTATAIAARAAGARLVFLSPPTLWIRSLAGSFSLICNFYAMTRLPVGDVLTITNTYPLWIILATAAAARRVPGRGEVFGVLLGLLGVALIQRPQLDGDRLAALVALAGSFSTTVAMLGLHRLRNVDPRAVVVHFSATAAIFGALGIALRGPVWDSFDSSATTWLLLLGVGVSGTIGQVMLTKAYAAGKPSKVSVAALSQVVFGVGFDVLIWQRRLPIATLVGMALILGPTAWASSRRGTE
ncbi:MAG: DMT family transporter [Isosphaeraceae bacterium]|nr:DMT family transporter [Isosphaeraceae bacterium]